MSHTPGPWRVDLERPFTLGGDMVSVEAVSANGRLVRREVASCMLDTDSHPDGEEWLEDAANARLIAAAPDLLECLKECVAVIGVTDAELKTTPGYKKALAAIAKAEGNRC